MLLRASGANRNASYDLGAVMDPQRASGVAHGDVLIELVDAVMDANAPRAGATSVTVDARLVAARAAVVAALGDEALVDAAAVIAMFNQADRVADGAGIPLDEPLEMMTRELRQEIGVGRFSSAANSPRASY
jgi:hypothetical protein